MTGRGVLAVLDVLAGVRWFVRRAGGHAGMLMLAASQGNAGLYAALVVQPARRPTMRLFHRLSAVRQILRGQHGQPQPRALKGWSKTSLCKKESHGKR